MEWITFMWLWICTLCINMIISFHGLFSHYLCGHLPRVGHHISVQLKGTLCRHLHFTHPFIFLYHIFLPASCDIYHSTIHFYLLSMCFNTCEWKEPLTGRNQRKQACCHVFLKASENEDSSQIHYLYLV